VPFLAWICEGCHEPQKSRDHIWDCPGCDKEICEACFDRLGHCRTCAAGKSDEELRLDANATGRFDFEPDELAGVPAAEEPR